jgi:cysteine desulfuration protein SufE
MSEWNHLYQWQPPSYTALEQQFKALKQWQEKHRFLMHLSRSLPEMPDVLKTEQFLIPGCESQTWFAYQKIDHAYYFIAHSDARIMKGMLMLILSLCQGKTVQALNSESIRQKMLELKLIENLSASRSHGLYTVIDRIEALT